MVSQVNVLKTKDSSPLNVLNSLQVLRVTKIVLTQTRELSEGRVYSVPKILSDGLKTNSCHSLSFDLSRANRVPSESPTQGLSDGTLKPDLSLNTASLEAKNLKKWTFLKWSWSQG